MEIKCELNRRYRPPVFIKVIRRTTTQRVGHGHEVLVVVVVRQVIMVMVVGPAQMVVVVLLMEIAHRAMQIRIFVRIVLEFAGFVGLLMLLMLMGQRECVHKFVGEAVRVFVEVIR